MKLDTAARAATLSSKEVVSYDSALLATGANVRRLNVEGAELEGIHYLRALGNADTIRADADGKKVVLIGGSYIGCEVAASLVPVLVVECPAVGPVLLSEGEDVVQLDADRLAAAPLPLPEVRALPPFEVDAVRAEITAPLGGVEHHARAVRELAEAFPGRSVLAVEFATTDVETPLTIAARERRPVVLALGGEEQFEMAPGWPQNVTGRPGGSSSGGCGRPPTDGRRGRRRRPSSRPRRSPRRGAGSARRPPPPARSPRRPPPAS